MKIQQKKQVKREAIDQMIALEGMGAKNQTSEPPCAHMRDERALETTIKQARKSLKELESPYLSLKEDQSSSCNNNNN